jgi:DNA repair protein RecO (recombination protein O)
MTAPRTYQTEAIIIKRTRLGETDRVLVLYTPGGKTKAIAKGASRPGSKFGGHVELLTHSQLLLARGHAFDVVTQAQTIHSFLPLKENLKLMTGGMYIAELVDAFTEEDIEDRGLFRLMVEAFDQLSTAKFPDTVLRYFELQILDYSGYKPELGHCIACNKPLEPAANCFCAAQGGALCIECGFEEPVASPLSLNALKVMRLWQNCDFASALKVNINQELSTELELTLRDYIRYVLERRIKSADFMDKLKG